MMTGVRRWVSLAWVVALGIVAGGGCGRATDTERVSGPVRLVEVDVVNVDRSSIDSSLETVGTLFPWRFATVAAEVSGVIESIPESSEEVVYELDGTVHRRRLLLDIGHRVQRGDVLVRIDATHAELELRSAEARLKLAEDGLAELKAWKRTEEIDQLTASLRQREAVLRHAQAGLDAGRATSR